MRALYVIAAFALMLVACSSPATTRITAEESDPTVMSVAETPSVAPATSTPVPTAAPPPATRAPAPSAVPDDAPANVPVADDPTANGALFTPTGADDSETLQAALDEVPESGELRLGPGRFQIDETLIVRLDVRIIGAGNDQTFLERADDGAIINARNVSVGLQDIALVSSLETEADSRVPLLEIINSELHIGAISIESAPGTGAWIEDSTGSIEGSAFNNSGWIGLWVVGISDLTITTSTASRNGDGFLFDDDSTLQISNSSATLNSGAGFWWHSAAAGVASDNSATQNDLGYLVDGGAAPELVGNTAAGNAELGFAFREQSTPLVESNRAVDSTQGFYVDGEAAPTLIDNAATDNAEVGIAWYDESAGSASGMNFENNGQDLFVEETASPTIDGEDLAAVTGPAAATASETPTATSRDAPACPVGYSLEGSTCVRVLGSPRLTCADGALQGGSCVVQARAVPEQTCVTPYLLYRAAVGDPTLPGFDGTCAWFDNSGTCPEGDTYNPDAGGGEIFTHKCKRPPIVTYTCDAGVLATDVCEFSEPATLTCPVGTIRGSECIETTSPS